MVTCGMKTMNLLSVKVLEPNTVLTWHPQTLALKDGMGQLVMIIVLLLQGVEVVSLQQNTQPMILINHGEKCSE